MEGSAMAKLRPINLVARFVGRRTKFLQDMSDSNNPVNAKSEQCGVPSSRHLGTDAKHEPQSSRVFPSEATGRHSKCKHLETSEEKRFCGLIYPASGN